MSKAAVFYFRVSTKRQFDSSLGLDAQREIVRRYAANASVEPIAEFTECESGKVNDRPELAKALEMCRAKSAVLIVSKLDRLSRNAVFLLELQQSNVEFVCCDCPNVDRFTVGILGLVAQRERELISERTRLAILAAKKRGVRLGNPRWQKCIPKMNAGARLARLRHVEKVRPVVEEIRATGIVTLQALADCLNRRGIFTRTGKAWRASTIRRVILSLDADRVVPCSKVAA